MGVTRFLFPSDGSLLFRKSNKASSESFCFTRLLPVGGELLLLAALVFTLLMLLAGGFAAVVDLTVDDGAAPPVNAKALGV
jgi:hypothetical protein